MIDLNEPAEEEKTINKKQVKRKNAFRKYVIKLNSDPIRKEEYLKLRREREREWNAKRLDRMTEEEKVAHRERTRKRKNATYMKRKERFDGMSSKKEMERRRIQKIIAEGKQISKKDQDYLFSIRELDRERAKRRRVLKSGQESDNLSKVKDKQ